MPKLKKEKNEANSLSIIKAKTLPSKSSNQLKTFTVKNVEELKSRNDEDLVFSFLLLDTQHEAFNFRDICNEWHETFYDVLRDLSGKKWAEVQLEKHYRAHKHNFNKTNYKFDFDQATLDQYEGCQFGLGKTKGRVHGFIIGNRFYVYWIDPNHNMNDSPGHEGEVLKVPVEKCYEYLSEYNLELLSEIGELNKKYIALEDTYNEFLVEHEELMDQNKELREENLRLKDIISGVAKKRDNYNKKLKKRQSKK